MKYQIAVHRIVREYEAAKEKHSSIKSYHEGYAIILEELDELWEEIKQATPDSSKMEKEAAHVAAMALRFLVDCFK